jgi:predicted DsbA family dithiol-disulfide isomerase
MEIEVWSDVVCPWCYLGMARLERVLAAHPSSDDLQVTWRSFQLDPTADGRDETPALARLAKKYGAAEDDIRANWARLEAMGAAEGLEYHLESTRSANTFDAHRLLHLARTLGVADELKAAMFKAVFTDGLSVSDDEILLSLATSVGIDPVRAKATLASEEFGEDVRAEEAEAQALGVSGVPFFVFDRRYAVSGAQSVDVLTQALNEALATAE